MPSAVERYGYAVMNPADDPATRLRQRFHACGYVRSKDEGKAQDLAGKYRKGWEVRLVLRNDEDVQRTRRLIEQVGLKPGRPFLKSGRPVQPIYGKAAVDWFRADEGS